MKLKSAPPAKGRRRGRPASLFSTLTGKWGRQHRLPAHVTGEADWEVEVPHIRMSRAFAVMLLLHVVAVGGLFAFRHWGREEEVKAGAESAVTPAAAESAAPAATVAAAPAPGVPETPPPAPEAPAPVAEPVRTYTWHNGDSLPLVAARFGISGEALRKANTSVQFVPGAEIVIPRSGRVIDSDEIARNTKQTAEFFNPDAPAAGPAAAPAAAAPPRAEVVPESEDEGSAPAPAAPVKTVPKGAPPKPAAERAIVQKSPETQAPKVNAAKVTAVVPAVKPATRPAVAKTTPETPVKAQPKTTGSPVVAPGQKSHVVGKGDTVFNVAKRYGLSAGELAKANGLSSDFRIRMGQQLRIPVHR